MEEERWMAEEGRWALFSSGFGDGWSIGGVKSMVKRQKPRVKTPRRAEAAADPAACGPGPKPALAPATGGSIRE